MSPAFSIVTDSSPQQTQVMSPNAPPQSLSAASASVAPQLQHFDEPSSEIVVRMRMQQMLQIQAPAEVLRLLQSSAAVVADAKTIKDVQSNVRLVAQELEARTERLASCLSGITGDLDGVKHQSERLLNAASDHHAALNNANNKFKELEEQIQQIESAVTQLSRRQVTFESAMETRLGALENQIIQLRAQAASADALKDEVVSMKATLSRLEHQQPEIQQSAQTKSEESETRIQRRIDEMDVLLKHFFERVDGNEKLCEKLRQRSEDLTSRFETLQTHVDEGFSSESRALPRRPQLQMPQQIAEEVSDERFEEEAKAQEIIETPKHRTTSGVQMFQMTPQRDGADDSWQKDAVDEWLEQVEEPQVVQSVPAEPPGLGSSGAKIPAGQWKLIKDFPKLTIPHGEPWEKGMVFRQWCTEAASLAEAISPYFAQFFRKRVQEGQTNYEKRLRDGCESTLPAVHQEEREMETRLSLALLKAIPSSLKQPALEKGTPNEAVSTIALMETVSEVLMPGGITEQVSLQRFLRQLPTASSCKELLATLRRWRLAKQRADHLGVPEQAPHESIAALNSLCQQLEKKHALLGTRLSLLRLQHNIQVPSHDGVTSFLQVLEAECTRIQAEEQTSSSSKDARKHEGDEYAIPSANQATGGKGVGVKPLFSYFNTARGCLKGANCEFRHEKISNKGKEAKGKSGKDGKDARNSSSDKGKSSGKGDAKAIADAKAAEEAKAKAAAEAKAKEVPSLVGAVGPTSSGSTAPRIMMAQSLDCESNDLSESESLESEIPMRAEGDTPEWSEVERGDFSSAEPSSEEEGQAGEDQPRQLHPLRLWVLNLTIEDFIMWTRPGHIQSHATSEFQIEANPNSIMWPVWWTIEHDYLDDNEQGVIPVTEDVVMLRCDVTPVLFEDGIIRNVFVVWLLEEETGRERRVAVIRGRVRPIVTPWPNRELSTAASASSPPVAKAPTITAPPPELHQGFPRIGYPITPLAKAAAYAWRANEIQAIEAVTAVPKAAAKAVARAFQVPFVTAPRAKATAFPKARAVARAPRGGATMPTAMRCVCVEEELDFEPPMLVGAKAEPITASRLECVDQPVGSAVVSQQPSVLVDSGANETIRPWLADIKESGCTHTAVVTASGDRVAALRTRDGELCIKSTEDSRDWLLSVRRLVEAGGTFKWDREAATVSYFDGEGHEQYVDCRIQNGLPFLDWESFKPIRIMLSKHFKRRPTVARAATETALEWKSCQTCSIEELSEAVWNEEAYRMTAEESEEIAKAIWESESRARELLSRDSISHEDVWRLIREAHLKGQRTHRQDMLVNPDQDRVQIWIFGMFCHGGVTGITTVTRERPFLTRLLVRFIRQELPTLTFTTISLAIDATLRPHRDLTNAVGSVAGIVGISKFEGGKLWIEDSAGTARRRVSQDEVKTGMLLDVCQKAHIFDPRRWHGAEQHRGVRSTVVGYTARQLQRLDQDMTDRLRRLGFNLPEVSSKATVAVASQGKAMAHQAVSEVSDHGAQEDSRVHPDDLDDEDEGEGCSGYEGFVSSGTSGRCEHCEISLVRDIGSSVQPWSVRSAEAVNPVSSFDEVSQQRAIELLRRKCAQGLYERHCPSCAEAHGHKRKCRRLTPEEIGEGTLSMDLSGPHPAAFSGHRYFMVANLSRKDGSDIPFSRLLFTKQTEEVAKALTSVMCQIVSLAQGVPPVFRIHSDAGKEFVGGAFQKAVEQCCVWPTMSAPYTPQQNGRAERLVGLLKAAAGSLLLHSQFPLQLWDEAVLEATFLRRCRALKLLIPRDRPRMGDTVFVRKPTSSAGHPFEPRAEEGLFLANDERTPGGARVLVTRDGRTTVRVTQMPVLKDIEAIRWRIERGPQDQAVWVSTTGDVRWNAPPSDMITVEESVGEIQPWNDGNTASEIIRERFKKHLVPEAEKHLFGLFGHGFLVTPVEKEEPDGEARVEQQMIKDEATSQRLMVTEAADAGVFVNPSTPEWELNKWMAGLNKELDTMETKNVLEKVRQSEFPKAKPVPSKLVLTKKPMEDSEVIIRSDMGASEIAALIQQAWNPRVRLVACGNFEKDSKAHDPENFAGNPGAETVRILLSLLARRPTNMTAVVLDISCAFLNARLDRSPDAKPAHSAAEYPVQAWSPRQWEIERNGELDGVTLEPLPHHEHGLLNLESLESGTWLIRDSSGEIQGAMVMYVDDALIIGDLEICARLKAKLSSLWDLKEEGVWMPKEHTGSGAGEKGSIELRECECRIKWVMRVASSPNQDIARRQKEWYPHVLGSAADEPTVLVKLHTQNFNSGTGADMDSESWAGPTGRMVRIVVCFSADVVWGQSFDWSLGLFDTVQPAMRKRHKPWQLTFWVTYEHARGALGFTSCVLARLLDQLVFVWGDVCSVISGCHVTTERELQRNGQTSLSQQVGRGDVFPAVDRNVRGLTVGDTKDFPFTGDSGFGERRADWVVDYDRSYFGDVAVGMPVTVQGSTAVVEAVSDSSVRLDFNHPLAGNSGWRHVSEASSQSLSTDLPASRLGVAVLAWVRVEVLAAGDGVRTPQDGDKVSMNCEGGTDQEARRAIPQCTGGAAMFMAFQILFVSILAAADAMRAVEPSAVSAGPETSAYNEVVIPKVSELEEWREKLSSAEPLQLPIGSKDAFIIDISMRMALLAYGRTTSSGATGRVQFFAPGQEEPISMLELTVRGVEADAQRIAKLHLTERQAGLNSSQQDDSPYAVVYMVKLPEGGHGLILSFKGSTNSLDWMRNFNILPSRLRSDDRVKVHTGFATHVESIFKTLSRFGRSVASLYHAWAAWGIPSNIQNMADFVTSGDWKWCICVGHSLGGAMAAIAAEKIASAANRPNSVYAVSIAAPVPGNKAFVTDMKKKVQPQGGLRIENPFDLVPWSGYGGLRLISRDVNGIVWVLPKDQWMKRTAKISAHMIFNVIEHGEGNTTKHFRYEFGDHETNSDPAATAAKNYVDVDSLDANFRMPNIQS
ncbi:GIP [Symbiodinium sp. CCMP2592]|nr:GIP [Symbiodinium sp. CCMP2592]